MNETVRNESDSSILMPTSEVFTDPIADQPSEISPRKKYHFVAIIVFISLLSATALVLLNVLEKSTSAPTPIQTFEAPDKMPSSPKPASGEIVSGITCKGAKAIIETKELYCSATYGSQIHKQVINVTGPDGSVREVFATAHPADRYGEEYRTSCNTAGEEISDVSFSPDCQHLYFKVYSWEWSDEYILNINKPETVFKTDNSFGHISEIVWSTDGSRGVIVEMPNHMGGTGTHAVHALDSTKENELKLIWKVDDSTDPDSTFEIYGSIENVHFLDNDQVVFTPTLSESLQRSLSNDWVNTEYVYSFSLDGVRKLE